MASVDEMVVMNHRRSGAGMHLEETVLRETGSCVKLALKVDDTVLNTLLG